MTGVLSHVGDKHNIDILNNIRNTFIDINFILTTGQAKCGGWNSNLNRTKYSQ